MDYYEIKVAEKKSAYTVDPKKLPKEIDKLEKMMKKAAKDLDFEKAAQMRDQLIELKKMQLTKV
jgi:excinuclease ABC subunit B